MAFLLPVADAQSPPLAPPPPSAANCNYNINNNIAYSWDELSPALGGSGTPLAHGDYTAIKVTPNPLFQFNFCGTYYNEFTLVSKAFLCFEPGSQDCTPCCPYTPNSNVPSNTVGRPAVFAYYTDIYPGGCPGGGTSCTWWQVLGTAPNRRLVYEFKDVPYYGLSSPTLTFEIKLFEGTHCAEVHYRSTTQVINQGYQTLAGFQNAAGSAGWTYDYNPDGFNTNNVAWRACPAVAPPPPPPVCMPSSQTVLVGQPATLSAGGGTPSYSWSAPAGSPNSGVGTSFSTTYASAGTNTVTLTDSQGATAQCTVVVTPPPCGYNFSASIPYNFTDISTSGVFLAQGDDTTVDVSIPWMAFYCGNFSNIMRTASNGYICHGTGAGCTIRNPHATLPNAANPNAAVYAYWTDLHVNVCNSVTYPNCGTKYQVVGAAPNRVFIYSFKDVPFWSTGGAVTFQTKLFEATHCWEVHYKSVVPQSQIAAQAGMENPGGTAGLSWRYAASPGFAASSEAWRMCPGTPPPTVPPICAPATQTINTGTSATVSAGSGVFPYSWTSSPTGAFPPTGNQATFSALFPTAGTYSLTVTDSIGQSATCTVNVVAPACGMMIQPATYDFVDISTTGTQLFHGLDTQINVVPGAGFTFPYCGTNYSSIRTSSNGYICFGAVACTSFVPHATLPNPNTPNNAIYAYWTDLFVGNCNSVNPSTNCGTDWQMFGTAPNRVFIYSFHNVPFWSTGGSNTFQMKLFETGCAEIHYKSVTGSSTQRTVAGMENTAGTSALTWQNTPVPGFTKALQAWRLCPKPPFSAEADTFSFNEDQPAQAFDVFANDINTLGGSYSLVASTMPSKGTLSPPVGGVFTYKPFKDAVGNDLFTYTIEHSLTGKLSTGNVSISILPVNDEPSFQVPKRIVFLPGGGALVTPGWASVVQPAPSTALDETGQGISFNVAVANPGLFSIPPTLERTAGASSMQPNPLGGEHAMLRFKPSGAPGKSEVCFTALDSGGVATVTNSWGVSATGDNLSPSLCVEFVANQPPVAYFEPATDRAIPGQAITFDPCPGVAPRCSYDPNDSIAAYFWDFGDGYTSDFPSPSHVYGLPGEYLVQLTVTDEFGYTSQYLLMLTVGWPDAVPNEEDLGSGPLADAGENRTVRLGEFVRLSGAMQGGQEPDVYEWALVRGLGVELSDASLKDPTFTAPSAPGDLMFRLKVTLGSATSAPDYVIIHVVTGNTPPVVEAGDVQYAAPGALVTLDGSKSSDPDGTPLTFHWQQLDGGPRVDLAGTDLETTTFVAPVGTDVLTFRLRASDGIDSSYDEVSVILNPAGAAPLPRFTFDVVPDGLGQIRFQALDAPTASWDFGDGTTGEGLVVVHTFAPGTYEVTMSTGEGASAQSYTQHVVVGSIARDATPGGPNMLAVLGAMAMVALVAVGLVLVLLRRRA